MFKKLLAPASSKFGLFALALLTILVPPLLSACNSGSGTSSNNGNNIIIGTLPDGAKIYISSSSFTIASDTASTTGSIGIIGGIPGVSYTLIVNPVTPVSNSKSGTTAALPGVTTEPSPCILTTGSDNQNSCKISVTQNDAAAGNYNINLAVSSATGQTIPLTSTPLKIISSNNLPPTFNRGQLSIALDSSVKIGSSIHGSITLSNSVGVSNVTVQISSSDPSIAAVTSSPMPCVVSTAKPQCKITVTGVELNKAVTYINVSANGYPTTRVKISVVSSLPPAILITTSPPSSLKVVAGNSFTITARSRNNAVDTISFANGGINPDANITYNHTSCTVTADGSCSITVTVGPATSVMEPEGNEHITYTISITDQENTKLSTDSISFTVKFLFHGVNDIVLNPTGTAAYVATDYHIDKCDVESDGNLTNCADSGANRETASLITINSPDTLAYFGNVENLDQLLLCTINSVDGSLGNCRDSGAPQLKQVGEIIFNSSNTFAYYIAESDSSTLSLCNVASDGTLSNCRDSGANESINPGRIALNPTNTMAYILGGDYLLGTYIWQCNVGSDGNLSNCINSGLTGLGDALSFAINPAGTFLYITNDVDNTLLRCAINSDGRLSECINDSHKKFSAVGRVFGLAMHPSKPYMYLASSNNLVFKCVIDNDGRITGCSATGSQE